MISFKGTCDLLDSSPLSICTRDTMTIAEACLATFRIGDVEVEMILCTLVAVFSDDVFFTLTLPSCVAIAGCTSFFVAVTLSERRKSV